MKRSDKLLLTFCLSVLCLYGVINLALYVRMRQGKIISDLKTDEGWITRYKGKAPALLSLQGNVNVRLIPSDTFYIQYHQEEGDKIHWGPAGTDSLSIEGGTIEINPHDFYQRYSDYPWVDVHANARTHIRLTGLLALVKGLNKAGPAEWNLQAVNTQLWIGETYGNETNKIDFEHYDSIQVQAINSKLILHRNAIIEKLAVQLNDSSEINDQEVSVNRMELHYAPLSKLNLTGANLDKLKTILCN